jgi:hypothetical protein
LGGIRRPFAPLRAQIGHISGDFYGFSLGSFSSGCACPATAFRAETAITIHKIQCIALLAEDLEHEEIGTGFVGGGGIFGIGSGS